MTDEELRQLMAEAHGGDDPPPYHEIRARARPPRRWVPAVAFAAAAAAAAAWIALRPRPAPPPSVADLRVPAVAYPLDFLLDVPGADLLRTTPRFDPKEAWP
ncbi:MAG TPA: hypothetical protein VKE22_11865 [Haliangiales bacterium]|nr:hypothetical protein [Haliangiales bacterium]